MSEREGSENIIELQPDAEGVFRPVGIIKKQKAERVSPRTKAGKRVEIIKQVSKAINVPEVEQFLYGANAILGLVEKARKAFR